MSTITREGARPKVPEAHSYRVEWQAVRSTRARSALFYVYLAVALPYAAWRVQVTNWSVGHGPLLLLAELYGIAMATAYLWMAREVVVPVYHPPSRAATVDILIPTHSEPVDVLDATLRAAASVRGRSEVFVLDDARRAEVAALARRHGARYLARTTHEHAKAGNLNHGLLHSNAEFVMTLDADHAPVPAFLERVMGYFDDPSVGFVQTPQTYYNEDAFLFRRRRSGTWSEQGFFYQSIQPAKNRSNAAFFVGTSAVLRRAALDSIGGFNTETATEDIHTSIRIHARGWRSVFVPEALAFGLEVASFKEYFRQRRRWAAGSLGLLFRSKDSPLRTSGLTVAQRLHYLSSTAAHLMGVQKLVYFATPLITVLFMAAPVDVDFGAYAVVLAGHLTVTAGLTSAYAGGSYHFLHSESYALANAFAHVAGMSAIVKVERKLGVSKKGGSSAERSHAKTLIWLLGIAGVAGLWRGVSLLSSAGADDGLVRTSLVFIGLELLYLALFLGYLLAYERRTAAWNPARAARYQERRRRQRLARCLEVAERVVPLRVPSGTIEAERKLI